MSSCLWQHHLQTERNGRYKFLSCGAPLWFKTTIIIIIIITIIIDFNQTGANYLSCTKFGKFVGFVIYLFIFFIIL